MPMLANSPNHFLASLSPTDADLLRPHLRSLTLAQGAFIYKAEDLIERVYFPNRWRVQVRVIGNINKHAG